MAPPPSLNTEQQSALTLLRSNHNIFLTGSAGTGKSFLLQHYLRASPPSEQSPPISILASTGAAAILVGGRTFHSYFGLGIMEGGYTKTVERAATDRRVQKRLSAVKALVIDEVSMLSGVTLSAAEAIARRVRRSSAPWGGIRIIAVGDFAQLPPVNPFSTSRDWAFEDLVWTKSDFLPISLRSVMRTQEREFIDVLAEVRMGRVPPAVRAFLDRQTQLAPTGEYTTLLPHRDSVDQHNLSRLESLRSKSKTFETKFHGSAKNIETFRRHSPLPDKITLKPKALVMLRQNDPNGRFVNGSLATILDMEDEKITVRLEGTIAAGSSREIVIEPVDFTLLNADGDPVVVARNFPLSLAWAVTIHKAQGATLDAVYLDLTHAWEPGQAYVALSRARTPKRLYIRNWTVDSILADPQVRRFYADLESMSPNPGAQSSDRNNSDSDDDPYPAEDHAELSS